MGADQKKNINSNKQNKIKAQNDKENDKKNKNTKNEVHRSDETNENELPDTKS